MPVAPSQQLPKLEVLLYMWKRLEDHYIMVTKDGPIPAAGLQVAREYAIKNGYSGIKVVPT